MANRKKEWRILYTGMTIWFSFFSIFCFSQSIQTFTDRNNILIGEQVQLKIKAILPPGNPGLKNWFLIPDSISHFDIVDKGKVDSITNTDNSKTFEQTIVFTSFDSGKWVFPSLAANLVHVNGEAGETLNTDSIVVNVSYSPADSSNQLRDIKPIVPVTVIDNIWYYIAGGAVLLLLLILLLYRYFKKKGKAGPERSSSKLSPYDEAMKEITGLAQYNLQDTLEVKIFHTKLSAVFKRYLGRKQNTDLLNKTTSDLLIRMRENNMLQENIFMLATALRCSDAVKFAKYIPPAAESEKCRIKIKETIDYIERQTTNNKQ